jgi:DNA-binding response OmpR family regulator
MTPTARVLIVEDQHDIAANIWDFLERRGYEVDHTADGASGLMHAMRGNFDVIVLDLGLPRLDGLDLCRRLREAGRGTPVLMLTARDTLDDKLKGFAEGADDYMVKPFELKELEARIRALLRRTRPPGDAALAVGGLRFDPRSMIATRGGHSIPLTRAQAAILELLLRRSPGVVPQRALMDQVWPQRDGDARALHTHIYELRALVDKPFDGGMIQTVHGIGYRLVGGDA